MKIRFLKLIDIMQFIQKKCQYCSRWEHSTRKLCLECDQTFSKGTPLDNLSFGVGLIFFVMFSVRWRTVRPSVVKIAY